MHCAKCFFTERDVEDDTCLRCGRAYMPEANVYLGLMILVAASLAWTLRYLLTASPDPLVRPDLDLGAWTTWPVSSVQVPAYAFIVGLWLAMLAVAPIVAGILYGKRGGWLLVILIAIVGPSLGLAAVAAVGVWIAGSQTCRLHSKLASALLALIPPAAYWFIQTARSEVHTPATTLSEMMFVAPVTAVAFGAAASAAVVAAGRLDRWHVRWPGVLLAVLTASPMLVLLAAVGADEVRYGFLMHNRAAAGAIPPAGILDRYGAFLDRHPTSHRAAEVRARLALALEKADDDLRAGRPTPTSLWREVLENHPQSPWAVNARLHLGDEAAANGLLDDAERSYRDALDATRQTVAPTVDPLAEFSILRDLFVIGDSLRVLETADHLLAVRRETWMHLALLLENRPGPTGNRAACALYFKALPSRGTNRYYEQLRAAREADPTGPLADNIAFELAAFEADPNARAERLAQVATDFPGTDGAMLAHIEAGEDLRKRMGPDPGARRAARDHLLAAKDALDQRRSQDPNHPYAAALYDAVVKKLSSVEAAPHEAEAQP